MRNLNDYGKKPDLITLYLWGAVIVLAVVWIHPLVQEWFGPGEQGREVTQVVGQEMV